MQKKAWLTGFLVCVLSVQAYAVQLIPLGMPVGVCMTAQGVVISSMTQVESAAGAVSPGEKAGLQTGDILQTADGKDLTSSEQLADMVKDGNGEPIVVTGLRADTEISAQLQPVKSTVSGEYQLGLLIRDSMAGIGTVTYADPTDNSFGALGHPISDVDSGALLPLHSGCIVPAQVTDVVPGKSGEPGELIGQYDFSARIGELEQNTVCGIFGTLCEPIHYNAQAVCETASLSDVVLGEAEIISCVDGNTPRRYNIQIEKTDPQAQDGRSLTIRITDDALLSQTGGIVPGMSGSPILQDGKLVGAVTHVLVNNPQRGYGISIDDMLAAAHS